jgi:sugar lactone lactonase YvrE
VRLRVAIALALGLTVLAPVTQAADSGRGGVSVLAYIPSPGFPASAYPHPNGRIYVGTYDNPRGDSQASRVLEYSASGELLRSWTVPGQDLTADHGIQVTTSDAKGRLVLLDRTPARALLLDTKTGAFTQYATFADLKPCATTGNAQPCSPTTSDQPPMANYGAWGPDGSLYVTDYLQGVVWRVPPGGGAAKVWLADSRLDGNQFGTTCIRLLPDHKTLLIAQNTHAGLGGGTATNGNLYKVAINADGSPGDLQDFWDSQPGDLPDGFGLAQSGDVYIALSGANQVVEVGPDGKEVTRFSSPLFDTPSSAKFLGTKVIVPSQSYIAADPTKQTITALETGEQGEPEFIYGRDVTAPAISGLSARPKKSKSVTVRFRSSEAARVVIAIQRRTSKGHWEIKRTVTIPAKAGSNTARLSLASLRGRIVRVFLTAEDDSGNTTKVAGRRFRVT